MLVFWIRDADYLLRSKGKQDFEIGSIDQVLEARTDQPSILTAPTIAE